MRFAVLMEVPVKIAILRVVTRCSLVGNKFQRNLLPPSPGATLHHSVMSEMK
jgi:hypothetical protein